MFLLIPHFLFVLSVLAVPSEHKRDIFGLLDGNSHIYSTSHLTKQIFTTHTASTSSPSSSVNPSLSSSTEQRTPTSTPPTDPVQPTVVRTALASTPSIRPVSAESDHSSKTWQIIGIAIIAVLFIATSITSAMFFDRLWRFLKDVVCCTSRPLVSEEFILDCEKQNWDTRTISPSPSHLDHYKAESIREDASVYTTRARELPWNTDTQDWSTLRRQPSQRNDHPPTA